MERKILMEKARSYAVSAYAVFSHWAERPLTAWPDDLKALIREAEKTLGKENIWPPVQKKKSPEKSINVTAVVKYLINSKYGRRGDELGLDNVEHMDNEIFRKIYFDKNRLKTAVDLRDDLIQKYGDSLTIDLLYEFVPKFGWEL